MKYLFTFTIAVINSLLCIGQPHTLNQYIQTAIDNSPILKGYQNLLLSGQLDSQILKASTHTQVNFVSNDLYAPVIRGWGYDEAITNIAQVSGLLQASRAFLSKGNLSAQYRQIALQNRALRDTILLSRKDLIKTITEQYITTYGDQLTLDYSKELFDLLKNEEDALKKLARESVIKQTEFLAFTITVQNQELSFLQAQIQYNADFLTLNYLAGIMDTTITRLEEPKLEDSLPHDLYNSVFLQRYVTDSLRIANEKKLIDYGYKPSISAVADGGYNSSLQTTPYKNFGVSAGLNLRIPIYDGHLRNLKYQKLDIEERTRTLNRNYFLNQYNQQVSQLYIQLRGIDRLFDKIRHQLDYTKTLIDAYGKLLQTSDVKVTDFVTAITNYLNAQNLYRQNIVSRLKIMNQINYWSR